MDRLGEKCKEGVEDEGNEDIFLEGDEETKTGCPTGSDSTVAGGLDAEGTTGSRRKSPPWRGYCSRELQCCLPAEMWKAIVEVAATFSETQCLSEEDLQFLEGQPLDREVIRQQCESILSVLYERKVCQRNVDGCHNMWIMKPGALSRGRGIHCLLYCSAF